MIGQPKGRLKGKGWETVKWARLQAWLIHTPPPSADEKSVTGMVPRRLKPLEAQVLVHLSIRADEDGESYSSLEALAMDCALTPRWTTNEQGRTQGRHSQLSRALQALQDFQLIITKAGGRGQSSTREVLYDGEPFDEKALRKAALGSLRREPQVPQSGNRSTSGKSPHSSFETPEEKDQGRVPLSGNPLDSPIREPETDNDFTERLRARQALAAVGLAPTPIDLTDAEVNILASVAGYLPGDQWDTPSNSRQEMAA